MKATLAILRLKKIYPKNNQFFLLILLLTVNSSIAQLAVNNTLSPTQLADIIANDTTVLISNVTFTGAGQATGSFSNGNTTNVGLKSGVLLTTGKSINAIGPNNASGKGFNNGGLGDAGLTAWANKPTFDACVLEFDIVPTFDTLFVKYVFASEEYPEYANTTYNDVFGFFLDGPELPDLLNFAWVPGSFPPAPVCVNNINATVNPLYYINNPMVPGSTIQYDGFTKVLEATIGVVRGNTYHIRLAIADGSDGIFDTGVFLMANGLGSRTTLPIALSSHLISFNAIAQKNSNFIKWETNYENGSDFFEIERSKNGKTFVSIAKIKGQGNSSSLQSYQFTDNQPIAGNNYYRLKQVDLDGKFSYSKLTNVFNTLVSKPVLKIYPYPVQKGNNCTVQYKAEEESIIHIIGHDILGRTVYNKTQKCEAGQNEIAISSENFLQGQYFINIVAPGSVEKAIIAVY